MKDRRDGGGAARRAPGRGPGHTGLVRAAALIDDAPTGRWRIILVFDGDLDTHVPVTTVRNAETAAALWGLDPREIDYTEVGALLTG